MRLQYSKKETMVFLFFAILSLFFFIFDALTKDNFGVIDILWYVSEIVALVFLAFRPLYRISYRNYQFAKVDLIFIISSLCFFIALIGKCYLWFVH